VGGRATELTPAFSRLLLLPLVFISGMASLGVEFGASRLLAPYFGTSLYHGQVYTDDLAPIERLIDEVVFSYLTG
jgi:hypothetical protein